jgi:hypothetical protein
MRVVSEPSLGTRYARERGFAEAQYPLIGFVDDDNWVAPGWVNMAVELMSADPRLGAVSGISEAVSDGPLPEWLFRYQASYAVLTEQELAGMDRPPLRLPTAGLCVRKSAWQGLVASGFHSLVPGRVGRDLAGGEDTELTVALRFCGWKLEVDPRLRIEHYMPRHRLQWNYLRRLARGNDASTVLLDGYADHSLSLKPGLRRRMSEWWLYQLAQALRRLAARPGPLVAALISSGEPRHEVIEVEQIFGRAIGLLRFRKQYGFARRAVREASWRGLRSEDAPRGAADCAAAGV